MEDEKEETKTQSIKISKLEKVSRDKVVLINDPKRKIVRFESYHIKFFDDRSKFAQLNSMGLIDSAGNSIFVESPEDNENTNKEGYMKF